MAKLPVGDERQRARQSVGDRLRSGREALGLTQRAVADALGLTSLSVIHYEAGRTSFPTDQLPVLDVLGIDSCWVATGIPSLETRAAKDRFAEVLSWVRREAAIHELHLSAVQEIDIAWHVFCRLVQAQTPDAALGEPELVAAVQELLVNAADSTR